MLYPHINVRRQTYCHQYMKTYSFEIFEEKITPPTYKQETENIGPMENTLHWEKMTL